MLFTARTSERDGWTTVEISGDLDLATAPRFRAVTVPLDSAADIALDLAGVDLIDSVGLGLLLGLARRARIAGGRLCLVGLRPHHESLLETCGIAGLFPVRAQERLP